MISFSFFYAETGRKPLSGYRLHRCLKTKACVDPARDWAFTKIAMAFPGLYPDRERYELDEAGEVHSLTVSYLAEFFAKCMWKLFILNFLCVD